MAEYQGKRGHSEESARVTVLVSGRVQGVGYRAFAQRYALDLGLAGQSENLSDGRVEVVAEGDREGLEQLLVHLRQGPTHAAVGDLDVIWGEATGLRGFYTY